MGAEADSGEALLRHVRALEDIRRTLLDRLADSLGAQLDRACARSGLPEPVIAGLLGISVEQMWDVRNGAAALPPNTVDRIRAFVAHVERDRD